MKCKACRQPFKPRNGLQRVCGFECALALVKKQKERSAAKLAKEERRTRAELRVKLKTYRELVSEAQAAFNRYIRARDKDKPCISCGRTEAGQWHAGHYRSTAAAPELRFHPDNLAKQCAQCNTYLSGNLIKYREGLLARIGAERLEALEGPHPPAKWTRDELVAMRAEFNRMARELEKE